MPRAGGISVVTCAIALAIWSPCAWAQTPRVRFPDGTSLADPANRLAQFTPSPAPPTPLAPITPAPAPFGGAPQFGTPGTLTPNFGGGAPVGQPLPQSPGFGGASLGQPQFDPYAPYGGAANTQPSLFGAPTAPQPRPAFPQSGSLFGSSPAPGVSPYSPPPPLGGPVLGTPPGATPYGAPYGGAPYGGAPYGGVPYGSAPSPGWPGSQPLVNPVPSPYYNPPYGAPPGGTPYYTPPGGAPYGGAPVAPGYGTGWAGGAASGPPYERLMQNTGGRYTWLADMGGTKLEINEVEVFTTMVWNNFIFNEYPLRITPGFAVDFLEGPPVPGMSELPGALYNAYAELTWMPQVTPEFGLQFVVRPCVCTDFNTFTAHSIRVPALAVGVMNVSPTLAVKLGAWWIDRNRYKLFPAVGLLWTPNEQTRFDIFFPSPKLSHYLTTVGNAELWWYIGGEYGGGAWTIARTTPPLVSERIDINDIRVYGGVEWTTARNWKGFLEVGYVFEREVVFVVAPGDTTQLGNTFMARGGLAF